MKFIQLDDGIVINLANVLDFEYRETKRELYIMYIDGQRLITEFDDAAYRRLIDRLDNFNLLCR